MIMHSCMYSSSSFVFGLSLIQMSFSFIKGAEDCYKVENVAYNDWSMSLKADSETTCWKRCQQTSWCFKSTFVNKPAAASILQVNIKQNCFLYNNTDVKQKQDNQSTGFICRVTCRFANENYVSDGDDFIIPYPSCKQKCSCSLKGGDGCVSLCPPEIVRCKEGERLTTYQQPITDTRCTCEKTKCEPQIAVEYVLTGGLLLLNCNISDISNIQWKRNGEYVNATNTKFQINNTALVIKDFSIADAGIYTCGNGKEYHVKPIPISKTSLAIIVGISVPAGVILLLVITVIVLCFKQAQKRKTQNSNVKKEDPKLNLKTEEENMKRHYEDLTHEGKLTTYETLQNAIPNSTSNVPIYEVEYSKFTNNKNINIAMDYNYIEPIKLTKGLKSQNNYEISYDKNEGKIDGHLKLKNVDSGDYIVLSKLADTAKRAVEKDVYDDAYNYIDFS